VEKKSRDKNQFSGTNKHSTQPKGNGLSIIPDKQKWQKAPQNNRMDGGQKGELKKRGGKGRGFQNIDSRRKNSITQRKYSKKQTECVMTGDCQKIINPLE
jgi:hypothetical protein